MKVYYLIADCGDGSSVVEFYKSEELAQAQIDGDKDYDSYGCNEDGVSSFEVIGEITGIFFHDDGD